MPSRIATAAISQRRDACRACGSRRPESCLSLGPTPLVNSFLRSAADASEEARFPLEAFVCPRCSLVRQQESRSRGGKFILPIPDPRIV